MNINFSVFIATSVDGYIARTNGKLDWLNNAAGKNTQEDYGYHQYLSKIDCIVMGRATFEKAASFPEWPYIGKRVIILSRTLNRVPEDLEDKVTLFSGEIELLAIELQNFGVRNVYVDGGMTIQSFIRAELIDEITITQIPVLIGKGLSLFGETLKDVRLSLLGSRSFKNGFVQSHYRIERYAAKYFD